MRRLFFMAFAIFTIMLALPAQAKASQNEADNVEFVLENAQLVTASNGSKVLEVLVRANAAVDDLCNYFDGSWVDAGVTLYCALGGDVYTCTAHKVVKTVCSINGTVRLFIEGADTETIIRHMMYDAAKIYGLSKLSSNSYKLSEQR